MARASSAAAAAAAAGSSSSTEAKGSPMKRRGVSFSSKVNVTLTFDPMGSPKHLLPTDDARARRNVRSRAVTPRRMPTRRSLRLASKYDREEEVSSSFSSSSSSFISTTNTEAADATVVANKTLQWVPSASSPPKEQQEETRTARRARMGRLLERNINTMPQQKLLQKTKQQLVATEAIHMVKKFHAGSIKAKQVQQQLTRPIPSPKPAAPGPMLLLAGSPTKRRRMNKAEPMTANTKTGQYAAEIEGICSRLVTRVVSSAKASAAISIAKTEAEVKAQAARAREAEAEAASALAAARRVADAVAAAHATSAAAAAAAPLVAAEIASTVVIETTINNTQQRQQQQQQQQQQEEDMMSSVMVATNSSEELGVEAVTAVAAVVPSMILLPSNVWTTSTPLAPRLIHAACLGVYTWAPLDLRSTSPPADDTFVGCLSP